MRKIEGEVPVLDCVEAFRFVWLKQLKLCREYIAIANLMGGTFVYNTSSKQYTAQSTCFQPVTKNNLSKKRVHSENFEIHTLECTGCGRTNHLVTTCHFSSSPYKNKVVESTALVLRTLNS